MIKLTVLALMTISALCNTSSATSSTNLMGSGTGMQGQQYPMGPNNQYDRESEMIVAGTFIAMVIGCVVVAGVNIFLCIKCYNKRAISKKIKNQMMFKRLEFATSNGISVQQLNDPRYSQTIHI